MPSTYLPASSDIDEAQEMLLEMPSHSKEKKSKFRQAYYTNMLSLSEDELKRMIKDMALIANLHPLSLGIKHENDGGITIAKTR